MSIYNLLNTNQITIFWHAKYMHIGSSKHAPWYSKLGILEHLFLRNLFKEQ